MRILGISAFHRDSAAALLMDGRIVAAASEERFSRVRHDARFPEAAIAYCLESAACGLDGIDFVAFYEKPFIKFERLLDTYVAYAPRGFPSFKSGVPTWLQEILFQKGALKKNLHSLAGDKPWQGEILFAEYHQSHAASAFYPSPFETAAVLTVDGIGEWTTTACGIGSGNTLDIVKEIHFPHSLGSLRAAFADHLGFNAEDGQHKLMGLAPYGEPKYAGRIMEHLIDVKADGSFRLNMDYFDYCVGARITNQRFAEFIGSARREPSQSLEQQHFDLAASIQSVTDEVIIRLARGVKTETGARNLCMSGDLAQNCIANGRLSREALFDALWFQPAAGDAGGALGSAYCAFHRFQEKPRTVEPGDSMAGAYLGPAFDQREIEERLTAAGARFERLDGDQLFDRAAQALVDGRSVGWFQGGMEFGPRALGARSILADARQPGMQKALNLGIKNRQSFRPLAVSVLREKAGDWFELHQDSPYLHLAATIRPERRRATADSGPGPVGIERLNRLRSEIPAVTHVDHSAQIQTVDKRMNPRFHALLTAFDAKSGCPLLANMPFSRRDEPIVCTPEDAFECFMGTDLECLAIGDCFLTKGQQDQALRMSYNGAFELE